MDADTWKREYKRLLTAYNRAPNGAQADEYFGALSSYANIVVSAVVTEAIREGRTWPSVADLVERCRLHIRSHQAPTAVCQTCYGDLWVTVPMEMPTGMYPPGMAPEWMAQRCPACRRSEVEA